MNSNSSVVKYLGVLIGAPSLLFTCYLLYLRKRSHHPKEHVLTTLESGGNNNDEFRQHSIEMKIPQKHVAALIGYQGARIKELQSKSSTRIQFKEKTMPDETVDPDHEQTLMIRGIKRNVIYAEMEIRKLLLDASSQLAEEFYIKDDVCGIIIGKKGANIKELSSITNCKIKITDAVSVNCYAENCLLDSSIKYKKISFMGSIDQINIAKEMVLSRIKDEEEYKSRKWRNRY